VLHQSLAKVLNIQIYLTLTLSLGETVFGVSLMVSKLRAKSNSPLLFQKRSDIDIMANILSEANEATKKTRIMYRCNLSHSQLQLYLQVLNELGFLAPHSKKEDTKPKYFRTTSKGFKFLDAYHNLKSLMT